MGGGGAVLEVTSVDQSYNYIIKIKHVTSAFCNDYFGSTKTTIIGNV